MSKVTVIIPTYNRVELLKRALHSVAQQTMTDFQLYVADDGSTDATPEIPEHWPEELAHVKKEFLRYPHGGRAYDMVNRTIDRTSSVFVAVLSDDDFWEPTFLERCAAFDPTRYSITYSDYFGVRGKERWVIRLGEEDATQKVRWTQPLNLSAAVLSRHFLDRLLAEDGHYFVPGYHFSGDWELTVRLAKLAPFLHVPEPLSNYRFHEGQGTNRIRMRKIFEDAAIRGLAGNPMGLHDMARLWRWWISTKSGLTLARLRASP